MLSHSLSKKQWLTWHVCQSCSHLLSDIVNVFAIKHYCHMVLTKKIALTISFVMHTWEIAEDK